MIDVCAMCIVLYQHRYYYTFFFFYYFQTVFQEKTCKLIKGTFQESPRLRLTDLRKRIKCYIEKDEGGGRGGGKRRKSSPLKTNLIYYVGARVSN